MLGDALTRTNRCRVQRWFTERLLGRKSNAITTDEVLRADFERCNVRAYRRNVVHELECGDGLHRRALLRPMRRILIGRPFLGPVGSRRETVGAGAQGPGLGLGDIGAKALAVSRCGRLDRESSRWRASSATP